MGGVFAGRYELVDPLGEGGGGVVWRVWDRRDRRYLAAKVLRDVDATSLLRFMREQSFRIEHPHVLTPLGWAGEDDRVLFTMPLVRGGSVASLVGDYGALPVPLVGELAGQMLAALDAIHRLGLVHRDVKPANLLLDATGVDAPQLWLSDFGLATGVNDPRLTHGPGMVGTTGYVAPEVRAGADPHPAADMYGAGMTMVEMLTGVPPEGDTAAAALLEGLDVLGVLADLVGELTSTDPAARPDAASARQRLESSRLSWSVPAGSDPGDPIEIFDHVPQLPPGWAAVGPDSTGSTEAEDGERAAEPDQRGLVDRSLVGPVIQIVAGVALVVLALVLTIR